MRFKHLLAASTLLVAALAARAAHADAPAVLPVQGYLTSSAGVPVDGATDVTISFYVSDTATTALYSETQSLLVDKGYFTAYVGDVNTLDLALFRDHAQVFVGIKVGTDPEMSPRPQLGAVPFAAAAQFAPWAGLTGVPPDLLDGDQTGPTYTAGTGISITGTTISADTAALQARVTGACPAGQHMNAVNADGTVACTADADTRYTASGGVTLTGTNFTADTSVLQARVTGACTAGQAVTAIGAGGTVSCAALGSTYTAGTGLTLAGTTFAVDTSAIQARVTGSCPAGSSIQSIGAGGAVTCQLDTNTTYTGAAGITLSGTTFVPDLTMLQARVATPCGANQAIAAIALNGTPTCVSTAGTTYTAGTGLVLTGTTFSVDTANVQKRVTGTCAVGQSIRAIAADGTVTCQVDSVGAAPIVTVLRINSSGSTAAPSLTSAALYRTVGTFTKAAASSIIQVALTDHVKNGGIASSFCQWELRIDNLPPAGVAFPDGYGSVQYGTGDSLMSQTNVFTGLSAGSHTLQIFLRGSSSACSDNAGTFDMPTFITEM